MSPTYSSLALEEKNYSSTQLENTLSTRYLEDSAHVVEKPLKVVKVSGQLTVSF